MPEEREYFDREKYPNLRRVAYGDRGRTELVSVSETSDGFLTGYANFYPGHGGAPYSHSVFLGRVGDFTDAKS